MRSAVVLLYFAFFPRVRGKEIVNPRIKTWKSFLHLNSFIFVLESFRLPALKWFQIVPGKHRKRDVATVFAYSYLNTPIDQWECAYCLKNFIKYYNNIIIHQIFHLHTIITWPNIVIPPKTTNNATVHSYEFKHSESSKSSKTSWYNMCKFTWHV